jgi:hypothetical protein
MSDVKVFATPEAYELLTDVSKGEETKAAVRAAFRLVSDKLKCPDYFIQGCPIALAAYWSDDPSKDSIVLLDKHKGFQLFYCLDNYKFFFEKLETALPIFLD